MIQYWTDLGFYSRDSTLGNRYLPMLGTYVALTVGIFLRQISAFPTVDLRVENVRWTVVGASVIVAAVMLPPMIRWISKRHSGQPTIEHFLWALTYGFFSDLLLKTIMAEVARVGI